MTWELTETSNHSIEKLQDSGFQSELKGLLLEGWEPFAVSERHVYLRRFIPDIRETGNEVLDTYGELRAIK
jgi:hypothetical protein